MVRLWGLRVREDQKEEETMKLHRLRAWCACQSPMNISLSQPYRDFTISIRMRCPMGKCPEDRPLDTVMEMPYHQRYIPGKFH